MRALAVTLVAAVGLSGCGGSSGSGPKTLPPVSASPVVVASPSAVPTGMDAPTPEGAEAFTRFFFDQLNAAFKTRDPDLIRRLSSPNCESCQAFIQSITRLRNNNEHVDNFAIRLNFVAAAALAGGTERVDVGWDAPTVSRYAASGKLISREPGLRGVEERLKLVRSARTWLVVDYTRTRVRG